MPLPLFTRDVPAGLKWSLLTLLFAFGLQSVATSQEATKKGESGDWKAMPFVAGTDGKGWQPSEFGRDGKVEFKQDLVSIGKGKPMTGIRWVGEFPKNRFEIRLEARRVEGDDFFVGLTFPVNDSHASLVLGGWSGAISGLSSIDGSDASENATTFFKKFSNNQWYRVRLSVTPERIQAWVDDEEVVNFECGSSQFSVRLEMDPSLPLGLATYSTGAEIRKFEYRLLEAAN